MVIIELILIIFRTIILSAIYSTIVLLILLIIVKYGNNNWAKKRVAKKFKFWLVTHFLISIVLLGSSLFYFHDTGFGDNSIVPIGFGQAIQNEDFEVSYFYPDLTKLDPNNDALDITNYIIAKNKICAEVAHQNTFSPKYDFIVYDLPTNKLLTFTTEKEYDIYATNNSLPLKHAFYNFEKHFREYISNKPFWRNWLLP